jgi:DNA-binding XRE family transcriptional regulator
LRGEYRAGCSRPGPFRGAGGEGRMARFELKGKAKREESTGATKPATPTDSLPGSEDKIQDMIRRRNARKPLCVPGDAGLDDRRALEMLPGTTISPGAKGHNGARRVAGVGDEEEIRARILGEETPPKKRRSGNKIIGLSMSGFPRILRDLRQMRRLSQGQLALKSGVSQPYLSQLESGRHDPNLAVLLALAKGLRVSLDRLCGYQPPPGDATCLPDTSTSRRPRTD